MRTKDAQAKARILIEALPWIRDFSGETIVIKYGGHAMVDDELRSAFATDVAFLRHVGLRPVVVHGGGPQIDAMLGRLDIAPNFKAGLRVTDEETMEVVRMVLTGKVQRELVSLINADAPYAVGLSGEDGGMLKGRPRIAEANGEKVDLGRVGDIAAVDPTPISQLLDAGRIPVVSTVASDVEGTGVLNINADTAAAAIAASLNARKLLMLTDVEGIYANFPDPDSLIKRMTAGQLRALTPSLAAGMVPKAQAALDAVSQGVRSVHVIDGRIAHAMLLEIFTDEGIGTLIEAGGPRDGRSPRGFAEDARTREESRGES